MCANCPKNIAFSCFLRLFERKNGLEWHVLPCFCVYLSTKLHTLHTLYARRAIVDCQPFRCASPPSQSAALPLAEQRPVQPTPPAPEPLDKPVENGVFANR